MPPASLPQLLPVASQDTKCFTASDTPTASICILPGCLQVWLCWAFIQLAHVSLGCLQCTVRGSECANPATDCIPPTPTGTSDPATTACGAPTEPTGGRAVPGEPYTLALKSDRQLPFETEWGL